MYTQKRNNSFSVLMSLYINSNFNEFEECMDSLISQTLSPSQIVIVLDGPVKLEFESLLNEIPLRFKSIKWKVIRIKNNQGLANALNEGLKYVSNELIFRVDTDDILQKNRFHSQIQFSIANPQIDIIGGQVIYIDKFGKRINHRRNVPTDDNSIKRTLLIKNNLNHPTVLIKKSIICDVGGYDDIPLYEDWFLWIKLADKGYKFANLPIPIIKYRIRDLTERRGFKILKKEIYFYYKLYQNKVNKYQIIPLILLIKCFVRILPKRMYLITKKIYNQI